MKKALTILFLTMLVIFSLFPATNAKAVWMQINLTITSVKVPLRAAFINWPPDREFRIDAKSLVFSIIDPEALTNGGIIVAVNSSAPASDQNKIFAGTKFTLSFNHEKAVGAYTPRLTLGAYMASSTWPDVGRPTANCLNGSTYFYVNLFSAENGSPAICSGAGYGGPSSNRGGLHMPDQYTNFDFDPI